MKKIKKILLLLLAFSFTTLLFNSQAYAVEYYSFESTILTETSLSNGTYDFLLEYGDNITDIYVNDLLVPKDYMIHNNNNQLGVVYSSNDELTLIYGILNDDTMSSITFSDYSLSVNDKILFATNVQITFTKTFWDQIINVVGDIASAFQAAATAGISLIYDGTALTSLGEIITITLGVGLVIGLFYLVIRVLPGARL